VLAIALARRPRRFPTRWKGEKLYRFTARWGEARDTDDCEGKVTATSDVRPTREQILARLPNFIGEIMQVPPAFSAIKVEGARAYDLARGGETVDLASRPIVIHEAALSPCPIPNMPCSRWHAARAPTSGPGCAIGDGAGTVGHVSELRRLRVGLFP
jgi:tRNA pseudouridine55 synthase